MIFNLFVYGSCNMTQELAITLNMDKVNSSSFGLLNEDCCQENTGIVCDGIKSLQLAKPSYWKLNWQQ